MMERTTNFGKHVRVYVGQLIKWFHGRFIYNDESHYLRSADMDLLSALNVCTETGVKTFMFSASLTWNEGIQIDESDICGKCYVK